LASCLSREEAGEAGPRRPLRGYEMAEVSSPIQVVRMILAFPRRLRVDGYFYSRRSRDGCADGVQRRFDPDLRALFVRGQYVADVRGTPKILDSRHGLAEVLEYSRYKPFPLSAGYWLEAGSSLRGAAASPAGSTCAPQPRAGMETLEAMAPERDRLVPMGRQHLFRSLRRAVRRDTICFVAGWTTIPTRMHVRFCARTLPLVRLQRPDAKLIIVGADPTPAVRKLGELPVSRSRLGGRCSSAFETLRAHGGSAQHRPRTRTRSWRPMASGVPVG